MGFTLHLEYVALFLNFVLFFFYYEKNMHLNFRKKCFLACMGLSVASIIINIASVLTLGKITDGWNFLLNGAYYFFVMLNVSVLAMFLFYLMFEHVPQKKCKKIAFGIIGFFFCIVIVLTIANFWTGCLFTVENGIYTRGPLNAVGYAGVAVELFLLVVCFFRNRKYINASMTKLMRLLPIVVAVLIIIQMWNRDIMMNGIISGMASLILFIISQSSLLEQDALTELENRTSLINDMNQKMKRKEPFQFMTISLKGFSSVNRRFGHDIGNEYLYQVARYLEKNYAEGKAYRMGGVEFALILPYVSEEYAAHCRQEVYQRFMQKWEVHQYSYTLRAGIGDIIWRGAEMETTQLIEEMQYVQNIVKEKKGTQLLHFDDTVRKTLERRKYLVDCMKYAISEDRFEIYYQPVYNWIEDSYTSMEALLRLRDKDGTMISPAEFIPLAEEVGLIDNIGWIVLDKVCGFLGDHPELTIPGASVNMSLQQFMNEGFVEKVENCLQKYQVDPQQIRIEITERMISENPQRTVDILNTLTEKGFRFYLDDFGMGYSNFSGVLSLPIETIKLDLTLVHGAMESERKFHALEALALMLRRAHYSVVAEGIETDEMAEMIKSLGVDMLQGYYYYRPLPESEILNLFTK